MADMVRYIIAIALLFGIGYLMGFRIETDAGSSLAAVVLVLAFGFCLNWVTVFLWRARQGRGRSHGLRVHRVHPADARL